MKKEEINLCFITDNRFAMPTGVAMYSILKNKNKSTHINNYIICDNVDEENKIKLYEIQKDDFIINLIDMKQNQDFSEYKIDNITATISAIYKFFIPNILKDLDKIIYLDGDIIVQNDLCDLYNLDLKENYVAAVKDPTSLFYNVEYYFNSGVMLMNLKKMRQDNITSKLIEYRKNGHNILMDQDAFNYILKGNVHMLPLEYNLCTGIIEQGILEYKKFSIDNIKRMLNVKDDINSYEDLLSSSVIVHYAGLKPWMYRGLFCTDLWTKYFYNSIYKDMKLDTSFYYTNIFSKTNTYKFYKLMYSIVKKIINPFLFFTKKRINSKKRRKFLNQFK